MKKVLFIMAVILGGMTAMAQNLDKNEAKQLQAFAKVNATALSATDMKAIGSIEGVKVVGGHVTEIDWKDKKLSGALDLSGFKALTKVDVSRNDLTSLNVSGCANLTELNASRNKLSDIKLDGCSALQTLTIYKNRLAEIDLTDVPALKKLNVSNNLFVELSLQNSPTLETLNCQGCHLEALNVSGCTAL